jgi:hypothetical protein
MLVGGETSFSFRLTLTSLNSECIHKLTGPTSVSGSKIEPSVFTICASTTLGHEALKTGLNLASDVMEGQNVTQAAKSKLKSTGQILLQKAIIGVGRSIKQAAKWKKPRRRETKLRNTSMSSLIACSNVHGDIPFQLNVGNNRDIRSPGNDGVALF